VLTTTSVPKQDQMLIDAHVEIIPHLAGCVMTTRFVSEQDQVLMDAPVEGIPHLAVPAVAGI